MPLDFKHQLATVSFNLNGIKKGWQFIGFAVKIRYDKRDEPYTSDAISRIYRDCAASMGTFTR